jgi:uncharacterized protein
MVETPEPGLPDGAQAPPAGPDAVTAHGPGPSVVPRPGAGAPAPAVGTVRSSASAPGQGPVDEADRRLWSTVSHLGGLLFGLGAIGFVGPLIVYSVYRDRDPAIRGHAAQALNFQLAIEAGYLVSLLLLPVFRIGLFTGAAVYLVSAGFSVLAAMTAHQGGTFRYPFAVHLVD